MIYAHSFKLILGYMKLAKVDKTGFSGIFPSLLFFLSGHPALLLLKLPVTEEAGVSL